jgi:hypothetical protein
MRGAIPGWLGLAGALAILAGCEDPIVTVVNPILQVTPERLDFGIVELTQEAQKPFTMKNLEQVAVDIESIEVVDDCGGCFLVLDPPAKVLAYDTVEVAVRFRAVRLEVATGTVTITSNDPKAPKHRVFLAGRGSDLRRPCIEVVPTRVDFGFVPAGGIAVSSFVVRSCGTNDLLVDRITIDPPEAPFRITTSTPAPGHPGRLPPGAQASVSLRAELPRTETGTITAKVIIETNVLEVQNVPERPGVVAVPLIALANLPPVAVPGEDQVIEPWSRVTLDGSASYDQDVPPDDPLRFRWIMVRQPGGSTAELERANTAQPSFWADLTGQYELELVVQDGLGLESEPKRVVVEALPDNAVRIELTWDHPDSDLDLHLVRESGMFCDCTTDVHYRDCGRTPNWFPTARGANPRLDVDDQTGFGPENINIDGDGPTRMIPPGRYAIGVHYFSSNGNISNWPTDVSNATVRVYLFGLLAGEFTQALNEHDYWTAATLNWPEQTLTPAVSLLTEQFCPAPL